MPAKENAVVRYRIDANQSRLIVRVAAGGLLSSFGHNPTLAARNFDGEVMFNPNNPENSRVEIRINSDSFTVTDNVSDDDRREIEHKTRQEVLESQSYPEIVFRSTRVSTNVTDNDQFPVAILGDLSLHGVMHRISIDSLISLRNNGLKARGGLWLRQKDFNIKLVSTLGGMLKVKDEIELSYDIFARQMADSGNLSSN